MHPTEPRLKEIGLMFDNVNRILDEAIASAEIDLLNTKKIAKTAIIKY